VQCAYTKKEGSKKKDTDTPREKKGGTERGRSPSTGLKEKKGGMSWKCAGKRRKTISTQTGNYESKGRKVCSSPGKTGKKRRNGEGRQSTPRG